MPELFSGGAPEFGGGHGEVRAQCSRTRSVGLVSGSVTDNVRTDVSGVSARCYERGMYGFSSMPEVSEDAARRVLTEARANAAFLGRHAGIDGRALAAVARGTIAEPKPYVDVPQKVYLDFLRALDDYIVRTYPDLDGREVHVRHQCFEKRLWTADAYCGHTILPRTHIYVTLKSRTPAGQAVELFQPLGGLGTMDEQFTTPEALFPEIDALYEKLMKKREGVYAEAGVKTVILGADICGILAHEAVGHTVEADLVRGGSVAGRCLGKQVASEKVTLVDFAHTALGKPAPLPVYIDDEGTPARDAVIIENGILKRYLNDRDSAARYEQEPLGNARAWGFSDEPLIRMRNTAILPGTDKLEDMISSVDDGYYLLVANNGQADLTGEFMFGVCHGYEIKNGKLGRAILDTTISGVAFEMLGTVDMVSDDMGWSSAGTCGKKQPMAVGMGGPALRCRVMIGGR